MLQFADMKRIRVSEWMIEQVLTIDTHESVDSAIRKMLGRSVSSLIVINKDTKKPEGILSKMDLVKIIHSRVDTTYTPVREVMNDQLVVVSKDASIEEAIDKMTSNNLKWLPVIDPQEDDRLVGILTTTTFLLNYLGV